MGLRAAFAVAEFRAMWMADVLSITGDQLARVALSVLVFDRTGSPAWTALTYALTMLPALASGVLLSGLADRYPRRGVMICCDVLRAALVAVMALPVTPLPVVVVLLVLVQFAQAPFTAAQGATLPLVLSGDRYEQGQTIRQITHQSSLLVGFAVGGLLVGWLGTHVSLGIDAATFAWSALVIGIGVRARPLVRTQDADRSPDQDGYWYRITQGARLIIGDRRLRMLVGIAWLAGFTVVPEGLAAPFAAQIGAGPAAVGVLMAADPAGMVVGAFLLARISPARRLPLLGPLAVGTSLPLACYLLHPHLVLALVLLAVSGACSAYQVIASATFVRLVPDERRGQALGFAGSGLVAAQGIGVAAGGLVAQWSLTPMSTIMAAGAAGTLLALAAATAWSRIGPRRIAAQIVPTE